MKRFSPKVGDVFFVKIDERRKKYFQSVAIDATQLSSSVIRAFRKAYDLEDNPSLPEIVKDDVEFYAHCSTKLGVKLNLWEPAGWMADVGKTDHILFRCTEDYGSKPGEQVAISQNWYVWRVNDRDFTTVGKLEGKYRNAEIGVVVNPYDIIDRIKTGKYNFVYPGF